MSRADLQLGSPAQLNRMVGSGSLYSLARLPGQALNNHNTEVVIQQQSQKGLADAEPNEESQEQCVPRFLGVLSVCWTTLQGEVVKYWLTGSRTGKRTAAPAELPGVNFLVLNTEASTGLRITAQRVDEIVQQEAAPTGTGIDQAKSEATESNES